MVLNNVLAVVVAMVVAQGEAGRAFLANHFQSKTACEAMLAPALRNQQHWLRIRHTIPSS